METIKDFDCVAMMRDIRNNVNKEIAGMNADEMIKFFNDQAEKFEALSENNTKFSDISE